MKKLRLVILLLCLFPLFEASLTALEIEDAKEDEQRIKQTKIGINIGIDYWGNYYWRSYSFYGEGQGAFFPWIGYALGDFYFYFGGEIASNTLAGEANDIEKERYGIDLMVSYTKSILNNNIKLAVDYGYYFYPNSRNEKYTSGSFYDLTEMALSFSLCSIPLSPGLSYTHLFWIDGSGLSADNCKDFYVKFFISKTIDLIEYANLGFNLYIAYFNYSYGNVKGISDISGEVKLSVSIENGLSVYGTFNFAVIPVDKFSSNGENNYMDWAKFGIMYSL